LCGQSKAVELVLKGSTFGAEEAKMNHLVDRIVPRRQVVESSMAFARNVMKNYKKQKYSLYLNQISTDEPFAN
jgi:enoyl-CoA hydratase/carnithine racemase